MLDIKQMRKNPEKFKQGLRDRGENPAVIDDVLALDVRLRELKTERDRLRHKVNKMTKRYYEKHVKEKA